MRTAILKEKKRIDGRGLADVRQIKCEVGVLPRTHGSALFTRGETQALVVTTLGMSDDEQRLESLEGMQRSNFMLHYNFPPFSVGECGRRNRKKRNWPRKISMASNKLIIAFKGKLSIYVKSGI